MHLWLNAEYYWVKNPIIRADVCKCHARKADDLTVVRKYDTNYVNNIYNSNLFGDLKVQLMSYL